MPMRFDHFDPSGGEKRSCVVRTMTKLTGKEYLTVRAELSELAERLGCETYNDEAVFGEYMSAHGIHKYREYEDTKVGELDLPSGTYCVFCTNREGFFHLLPIIDNVIYDRRNDSLELYVISVYKKEEV